MPRKPKSGICTVCQLEKPLFDVKNNVCGPCAGKKGGNTPKKPRKGRFACDTCEKPVKKGQQVCSCGAKVDWSIVHKVPHGPAAAAH